MEGWKLTYIKKTMDRNQYLLPSSCHSKSTTKAIPYWLSLRIIRICTKPEFRDIRLSELKELLLARQYPESLIDRSIERARKIPRKVALLKMRTKNKEKQPIFAVKYDPRMPTLQPMLAKHYRSMITQDSHLKQCFPKPPLTAFKRQGNIRNLLIKSKILHHQSCIQKET